MAERREVIHDLAAAGDVVEDDAGETGKLPVHEHDGPLRRDLLQVLVREPAGGEQEPVDRRHESLDLVVLDARRLLRVDEDEGVLRGPRPHLGPADELEVVGVRDVGDHHRHRVAPAGQQGSGVRIRPIPELGSDRQHALSSAGAHPGRRGKRAGHGGRRDTRCLGDVVDRGIGHGPNQPGLATNGNPLARSTHHP
jgi:hypothetical protein